MSNSLYETPDGENCLRKTFDVSWNAGYAGKLIGKSSVKLAMREHDASQSKHQMVEHMVGTNGSVDKQEVTFQNMSTWLLIPKYTRSGV